MRKRKRIKGVTSKTIAKMERLARELEAANGLRIRWGSLIWEGRQCFWFEPIVKAGRPSWLFCGCGFAYSVREALANFYIDMGQLLRDDMVPKAERGKYILGLDDYMPARFTESALTLARPTVHGKRVVLG